MSLRCLNLHWEKHLKDHSETSQKRRLFVTSLRQLKHMSKRCLFFDSLKTSQIHLKRDAFLRRLSRRLKYISKKIYFFCDIFQALKIYLKKDDFHVTSLRLLKHISKKMFILWWLCVIRPKYLSWNYQWADVCMLFISLVWATNRLAVLACQQSSNLSNRCIIYSFSNFFEW